MSAFGERLDTPRGTPRRPPPEAKFPTLKLSPLHEAAKDGDLDTLEYEVARGADVNACEGWARNTPLHLAAVGNQIGTLCLLVHHADVNARDVNLKTALHKACAASDIECIKLLLQAGADIHAKDEDGRTPRDVSTASIAAILDETKETKELRRATWVHTWKEED